MCKNRGHYLCARSSPLGILSKLFSHRLYEHGDHLKDTKRTVSQSDPHVQSGLGFQGNTFIYPYLPLALGWSRSSTSGWCSFCRHSHSFSCAFRAHDQWQQLILVKSVMCSVGGSKTSPFSLWLQPVANAAQLALVTPPLSLDYYDIMGALCIILKKYIEFQKKAF